MGFLQVTTAYYSFQWDNPFQKVEGAEPAGTPEGKCPRDFGGAVVRASAFHLWDREFESRYGLMWKESINDLLKVVGFLRARWFPPTGKVDRVY
jgi:hypothetical protein